MSTFPSPLVASVDVSKDRLEVRLGPDLRDVLRRGVEQVADTLESYDRYSRDLILKIVPLELEIRSMENLAKSEPDLYLQLIQEKR